MTNPKFFYAVAFLIYVQTLRLHYDLVRNVYGLPFSAYFLEFRYMTVWCMHIQFIYYSVQLYRVLFLKTHSQKISKTDSFINYLRTTIVFPVAFFVTLLFWGLYSINPYLLASKKKLEMTSHTVQHLLHTAPLVVQLLEGVLLNVPARFGRSKILTGQFIFQVLFVGNLFLFNGILGKFPYPVLDVIWAKSGVLFCAAAAFCIVPFYGLSRLCQKFYKFNKTV